MNQSIAAQFTQLKDQWEVLLFKAVNQEESALRAAQFALDEMEAQYYAAVHVAETLLDRQTSVELGLE